MIVVPSDLDLHFVDVVPSYPQFVSDLFVSLVVPPQNAFYPHAALSVLGRSIILHLIHSKSFQGSKIIDEEAQHQQNKSTSSVLLNNNCSALHKNI